MTEVKGSWKGESAGGGITNPTWRWNPQFILQLNDKTDNITIKLDQIEDNHIGFYITKPDEKKKRLLNIRNKLIAKSGFFSYKSVTLQINLEPGDYIVIPSTLDPKNEGNFTISTSHGTITKFDEKKEYYEISKNGEWKGLSAGGCKNHKSFKHNPQYHILVTGHSGIDSSEMESTLTQTTILVSQTKIPFNSLGFYVVKLSEQNDVSKVLSKNISFQTDFESDNQNEVIGSFNLQPGHYSVFPCTFEPGNESQFSMTIFSDKRIKFVDKSDKDQ